MRKATNQDYEKIVEYMERDIPNCIYMYIDILAYGLEGTNVQAWIEEKNGELSIIAMKYFSSFQLYSIGHDYDRQALLDLLEQEKPARINGDKQIIEDLWSQYDNGSYSIEYGTIMQLSNYIMRGKPEGILLAGEEDVEGIAQLIVDEPELNGGFTKEELMEQITERIRGGYGESYIIKEGDEIVAHICTNAECDKFLVGALTVVRADKRDTLYGSQLDAFYINMVKERGKDCYSFLKDPRRIRMFQAMKNKVVGEYGRIKLL